MLFSSVELAARIERAECRLLADGAEAVARRHPGVEVFVRSISGGIAVHTVSGSPLNKVAGLGFGGGALDEDELRAVESAFFSRGEAVAVELSNLADPAIGAALTRRGYTLEGFENVLGRSLPADSLPNPADGISVVESGDDELDAWIDVVVTGFASPDAEGVPSHEDFPREVLEGAIADMAASRGFFRYGAHRDGELAGAASFRVFEGVAQLTGAATLPRHRRRGVQTALLAARLGEAASRACDVAVVTTQPGSKSHENVQRRGFDLLYTRAILVRTPPAA